MSPCFLPRSCILSSPGKALLLSHGSCYLDWRHDQEVSPLSFFEQMGVMAKHCHRCRLLQKKSQSIAVASLVLGHLQELQVQKWGTGSGCNYPLLYFFYPAYVLLSCTSILPKYLPRHVCTSKDHLRCFLMLVS